MGKSKGGQRMNAADKPHYSSHIQLLNADSSTASPSLLLAFDSDRYLFNCGEGLQRLAWESKVRLSRIKTVLCTRASTDVLAGLPGLLLTLSNVGCDTKLGGLIEMEAMQAQLIGPPGCKEYSHAFQPYASHNISLDVLEAGEGYGNPVIQTNAVSIIPIFVQPSTQQQQEAAGEPGTGEPPAKRQRSAAGVGELTAAVAGMLAARQGVCCYLCECADMPGKFDPVKAKELGVPPGPLFGQLQRGTVITTPGGREVRPEEVMNPATLPGPRLLIVDCPSTEHVAAIQAAPRVQQLLQMLQQERAAGGAVERASSRMVAVVHLTPESVSSTPAYQSFIDTFGPGCSHMLASCSGQTTTTCRAAAQLQTKLNVLEPTVFPLGAIAASAALSNKQQQQQQQQQWQEEGSHVGAVLRPAPHMMRLVLTPAKQRGPSAAEVPPPLDLAAVRGSVLREHPKVAAMLRRFEASRAALLAALPAAGPGSAARQAGPGAAEDSAAAAEVPDVLRGIPRDVLEVVLLGTVSSVPSSHRNVSGYYLDFFGRGGALADCGEDSMGQLERRYGVADATRRVMDLQFIWISHMHADHHGGLYPLLQRRAEAGAPPILIIGPMTLFRVLQDYDKITPLRLLFLPSLHWHEAAQQGAPLRPPPQQVMDAYNAAKARLGLSGLEAFPVVHVSKSTGLKITGRRSASGGGDEGASRGAGGAAGSPGEAEWKVVFSGDTRPCDAVVEAARGGTLLVHEATFEDDLAADAVAKRHSTLSEALGVARSSGVYRTVLTHFSGRYPKIPVLSQQQQQQQEEEGQQRAAGAQAPLTAMVGTSVAVGFDLMTVNLADLPWLPMVVPACDELLREEGFADEEDEGAGEAE